MARGLWLVVFVVRVRVRGDSRLKLVGSVFKAIWQLHRSGFCVSILCSFC